MKESLPSKITVPEPELSREKIEENIQQAKNTGRLLEQAYWEAVKEGSVQHQIQPKTERPTPLKPGETFDPEQELAEVKSMPKKEKRKRLLEYKDKLAYQKEGLARIEEQLIKMIRDNPDMDWPELQLPPDCKSLSLLLELVLNHGTHSLFPIVVTTLPSLNI